MLKLDGCSLRFREETHIDLSLGRPVDAPPNEDDPLGR